MDVRLLGICGSIRKGSYNRTVLQTLRERAAPEVELDLFDIARLPHYCQDIDGDGAPDIVRLFRAEIADHDGLFIASPEYNYGMPGVLKNAIDWGSRPSFRSVMKGKPFAFMTSSIATTGGVRAQAQIREAMLSTLAELVNGPEVAIASVHEKVREGRLVDDTSLDFALAAVKRLADAIRQRAPVPA